jgi:hypothetical protein
VAAVSEPPGPAPRGWLRAIWFYGFTLVFAVACLVFGLYFGVQLLETQREGIAAINGIQAAEEVQLHQLEEISARLERIERNQLVISQQQAGGGGGGP